jgi:hypothetical protein
MLRPKTLLLTLTILSTTAVLQAQSTTQAPAPIERAYAPQAPTAPAAPQAPTGPATLTVAQPLATTTNTATAQPAPGIFVRAGQNTTVRAISLDPTHTELRVEAGLANISIHHPEHASEILIDLPGGRTALLKDGLYTFNATTNTIRVLKGEADAFPNGGASTITAKPLKVKEDHAVAFTGANLRSVEFGPLQARADLIPATNAPAPGYGGYRYGDGYPYGYSFYGGYPYYSYGYGYPYGYYGYPYGFGLGFGYIGGFGGGYGFGGGFRGRR